MLAALHDRFVIRVRSRVDGATAVEYSIVIALVAAVVIGAAMLLGDHLMKAAESSDEHRSGIEIEVDADH